MKNKVLLISFFAVVFIIASCKKSDPDPVPYAKFTVDGTSVEYNHATNFNKICIMSHYCGSFEMEKDAVDSNLLGIGLPSDVANGATYHAGDSDFLVTYYDGDSNFYSSYYGGTITLNVASWDYNEGSGWVEGTFSGSVHSENDPIHDSVVFQNGDFLGKIYVISF